MADTPQPSTPPPDALPKPVEKRPRISLVWLIPILAVCLGGWLLYKSVVEAGIPITITFETGAGLEGGKTKIMFKDVDMGLVDSIRVGEDMKHVVLQATLEPHAERYLKEGSRFWVVRPRITTEGISGLGTLLSGAYISLEPGTGAKARSFKGLEKPPIKNMDSPGHEYVLHASDLGSVGVGSPLYFRGIRVGEVLSYELDMDAGGVTMKIFVNAPHHVLVYKETQFWNVSGLDVIAGADGLEVRTASLEALLIGGIAFETPERVTKPTAAPDGVTFTLHRGHEDIDQFFKSKRKFVTFFEDSIRGLHVDAPVEFKGLQIGEVTDITTQLDRDALDVKIQVTMQLELERIVANAGSDEEAKRDFPRWIEKGLRAQLATGSLLTGKLFVDLVIEPDSPVRLIGGETPYPEVPTVPSNFAAMKKSVEAFLTKLENMEIDRLVTNLADTAESAKRLLDSPDLSATITAAKTALTDIDTLVKDVDGDLKRLATAGEDGLKELKNTLAKAEVVLVTLNDALGSKSVVRHDLATALKELAGAARSLRMLTSYLERHPEALLKGKPGSGGK